MPYFSSATVKCNPGCFDALIETCLRSKMEASNRGASNRPEVSCHDKSSEARNVFVVGSGLLPAKIDHFLS